MTTEPWKMKVALKYHIYFQCQNAIMASKVLLTVKNMLTECILSGYFIFFTKRQYLYTHMGWYLPLLDILCLCYMIIIKDKNQSSYSIFD